jgi:hypothetical protein
LRAHPYFTLQFLFNNFHKFDMNLTQTKYTWGVILKLKVTIMNSRKSIFGITALAATALATLALTVSSGSAISANCGSKAECACQVALDSGSRSAMRTFKRLYPHSNTACNALNTTSESGRPFDHPGNGMKDHISPSTPETRR